MECRHSWLTLSFSSAFSRSRLPFLSVYLRLLPAHQGRLPPFPPPILSGLIVLHLFIQAFMAASSSHKPISPPDDGFLSQLSRLFIINADPHPIFLTLGRWFSHWLALLARRITSPTWSSPNRTQWHSQDTSHHYITLQIYKVLKCCIVF